jgi:hypothetical protein
VSTSSQLRTHPPGYISSRIVDVLEFKIRSLPLDEPFLDLDHFSRSYPSRTEFDRPLIVPHHDGKTSLNHETLSILARLSPIRPTSDSSNPPTFRGPFKRRSHDPALEQRGNSYVTTFNVGAPGSSLPSRANDNLLTPLYPVSTPQSSPARPT